MRSLCFVAIAFLAACGTPPNHLDGSVLEVHDMTFDTVAISRVDAYLTIEYVNSKTSAKVAKLSVYVADLTIAAGNTVDLTGSVGTNPRATLQRVVEATIDLGIERGTLTFDKPPDVGSETVGKFRITTKTPAGRTFNGEFKASVVQK